MELLTDPVEYIDHASPLYKDIKQLAADHPRPVDHAGLAQGKLGSVSEPGGPEGARAFSEALERDPDVGAAVGLTTILRMLRYVSGEGDRWPDDPASSSSWPATWKTSCRSRTDAAGASSASTCWRRRR